MSMQLTKGARVSSLRTEREKQEGSRENVGGDEGGEGGEVRGKVVVGTFDRRWQQW